MGAVVIVSFNENNMNSITIFISLFILVNSSTIKKRQVQIPIQISGNLDVGIGTQCVLNGRTYKSGSSILDGCTDCKCTNGLVQCRFLRSIKEGCLYHEDRESTTPPPNGCKFENTYRYDGEVFTAQDGCNKCWCNKGEIICPYENDCENSVARRRSLNKSS